MGSISASMKLPALVHFDAHGNALRGSLPSSLSFATPLYYLFAFILVVPFSTVLKERTVRDLSDNAFSGTIPAQWSILVNLNYLCALNPKMFERP
jgi:hypothetical protein